MTMIPYFAHHVFPLLSGNGQQGALGGKGLLPAVKDACKIAGQVNRSLGLACRHEIAAVPPHPDFFHSDAGLAKARNLAWETIRGTLNLRWMLLTREPGNIRKALPADWIGQGFKNVCFGLVTDGTDDFPEKLTALRTTPAQHRMLLVVPAQQRIDLCGKLDGIDWVVFSGNADHQPQAEEIRQVCRQANVAFLFHRPDCGGPGVSSPVAGTVFGPIGDVSEWPEQPFGPEIQIHRPTLPDLKSPGGMAGASPQLQPSRGRETQSANSFISSVPEDPTPAEKPIAPVEEMHFEVVADQADTDAGTLVAAAESSATHAEEAPIAESESAEFARLDQLVREELQSFIRVGNALQQIRERELWRAGGYASWDAYCNAVAGFTRIHANRLIKTAGIADHLSQVKPIGSTPFLVPQSESQVRQLFRLKDPEKQAVAWCRSLDRAGGGQPTAKVVGEVVADLMAEETGPAKAKPARKPSRKQRLMEIFGRLSKAVHAKVPPKEIESVIGELKKALRLA